MSAPRSNNHAPEAPSSLAHSEIAPKKPSPRETHALSIADARRDANDLVEAHWSPAIDKASD